METNDLRLAKSATGTDAIRENGLSSENIVNAIDLDRDSIEEIDENNFLKKYFK